MNKISRILIPFNFSKSAERALEYAIEFSKDGSRTGILLLYVTSTDLSTKEITEIEDKFSEIKDKFLSKSRVVDISSNIETGDFVKKIIEARNSFQAEIIIMGTKGTKGDDHERNTNTSQLVEQAECPVLVIPQSFEGFKIENITLAIDKNEIEDPEALSTLLVIARRYDAKIHVLTIYEEDDKDYLKERKNESVLEYYFEKYYARSSSVKSSNIANSIIEYDKKQAIDLLAIIPRNHTKKSQPSKGSLTKYLTKSTDIPVLTID